MVHDLVVAADLRVFVVEGVEAVCAGDDDLLLGLLDTVEDVVEQLDVLHGELLEQEFVARAPGGVTGAGFLLPEDHELHARGREEFGDGLGGLLGAVFIRAGAADPEQVFVAVEGVGVAAVDGDGEVDLGDPVEPVLGVLAPGVALVLEVLEQSGEFGGEFRFDEDLVAAHVDDVVDVLDIDRALLDTRATGGARPQHLGIDDAVDILATDQRPLRLGARGLRNLRQRTLIRLALGVHQTDLVAAHVLAATGQQIRGLGVAVVPQRHDQQLGRERLARVPGRALRLAATTFGTGGDVEDVLPGEVLELADAEGVVVRVRGLHLDRLAVRHHRLGRTEGDRAVVLTLEIDIGERGEPVPGHTPGDIAADQQQEGRARDQLDEREDRHHDHRARQQLGHLLGEEVAPGVGFAVGGDLARLHEDHAQALDEDDGLDHIRGRELGTAETRQPLGHARVVQLPDDDQHQNADNRSDAQDFVHQVVDAPGSDDGPVEFGVEDLAVRLEPQDEPGEEADHDQPVRPADGAEFVHARMREEFHEHGLETREERPPAIGRGLPDHDGARDVPHASDERCPTENCEHRPNRAQRHCQGIHVATSLTVLRACARQPGSASGCTYPNGR
ncbi:hypothetical protein NS07_v2contig00079-0001 [Nocardia seriolae]|nr:hypothetical protein NS07_v2contig00079-0001 [Nocardia seriolae]